MIDDSSHCHSLSLILVKIKLEGHELPTVLPAHLVPPSKRHLINTHDHH